MTKSPRAKLVIGIVFVAITFLSLGLRAHFIEQNSPTFDEPYHLFQGVFFEQRKYWQEVGSHPPFFQWVIGKLSPYLGVFQDADQVMDSPDTFHSYFQYRMDEFSGMPADEALQRARWAFSFFWIVLAGSLAWIVRAFGWSAWASLALYAFVSLDPTFLAHSALLKNDMPPVAFLTLATALSLGTSTVTWLLALLAFTAAWSFKFSAIFWALPLALGLYFKKIPPRAAPAWLLGGLGSMIVTAWLGHPNPFYAPADPSLRLSYMDGILSRHPPLTYFLQLTLCKASLALYVAWGWIVAQRDRLPRKPLVVATTAILASLLAASFILPGIGIRLALPIVLVMIVLSTRPLDAPRIVLPIIALLGAEAVVYRDSLISYQNILAGAEPRFADSNADWGQGLKDLAAWRRGHPNDTLALSLFGGTMPETYGLTNYRAFASVPQLAGGEPLTMGGGYKGFIAVSRNFLDNYMLDDPSLYLLKSNFEPVTCFQGALCLFDVRQAKP